MQLHCRLDLTAPMPGCAANHRRHLLLEGDLKLKEANGSKASTHTHHAVHVRTWQHDHNDGSEGIIANAVTEQLHMYYE